MYSLSAMLFAGVLIIAWLVTMIELIRARWYESQLKMSSRHRLNIPRLYPPESRGWQPIKNELQKNELDE